MMRDKKGVHNSFESPDSINQIDWSNKNTYHDIYSYYRNLLHMRKAHPAFHMGDAELVRKHLQFLPTESGLVAYSLNGHAVGDSWEEIVVILNGRKHSATVDVPAGKYTVVCQEGRIDTDGISHVSGSRIKVAPQSAWIGYKK